MENDDRSTSRLPVVEWVRLQAKSEPTLDRLLDAAEALVLEKGFERTGVAEICRKADSSVGAFYARFTDKHALLRHLHDRFCEESAATAQAVLVAKRWEGVALSDFFTITTTFLLEVLTVRRELIAALIRAEQRPAPGDNMVTRIVPVVAELTVDFLRERAELGNHPRPEETVHFLCWLMFSSLVSHTAHVNEHHPLPPGRMVEHFVDMALGHLRLVRVG